MNKLIYLFIVILLVFFVYNIVRPQHKYTEIKPTKDFYVYDENNLFLSSTKYLIYQNSKALYEDSLKDNDVPENIRGIQVVVLALDENNNLNTTTVMNEWGIGKNDMGLLLTFYYDNSGEIPILTGYGYDAGTRMEHHLNAAVYENLVLDYLFPYYDEANIALLYYEVLNYIYVDIYGYDKFNYDINDYLDSMYVSYYTYLPSSHRNFYEYFNVPIWLNIVIFVFFGTVAGGSLVVINKGGGGRSKGYKYRN